MRRLVAILPLVLMALLGCGRSTSEQAAIDLAVRVLSGDASAADLEYRREVAGGFVWRLAPTPLSSAQANAPRPTHLGVIACVAGERATEAARFSYLHWEPEGCEKGRSQLRRVQRTPEQDARRLGTVISPPRRIEGDATIERLTG